MCNKVRNKSDDGHKHKERGHVTSVEAHPRFQEFLLKREKTDGPSNRLLTQQQHFLCSSFTFMHSDGIFHPHLCD